MHFDRNQMQSISQIMYMVQQEPTNGFKYGCYQFNDFYIRGIIYERKGGKANETNSRENECLSRGCNQVLACWYNCRLGNGVLLAYLIIYIVSGRIIV